MTHQMIDIGTIVGSWSGPRRVYRAPDMGAPLDRATTKTDALRHLLKTPTSAPRLAAATGLTEGQVTTALRYLRNHGQAKMTGERDTCAGRPRLWVAVEVQS